jgi:hypothetical protein
MAHEFGDAYSPVLGPVTGLGSQLSGGGPGSYEGKSQHENGSLTAKTHEQLLVREASWTGRD